jgi:hypothetical protein
MALTWGTIFAGFGVVFVLPILVILLNRRRRGLGWIVLCALIGLIILGNFIEAAMQS